MIKAPRKALQGIRKGGYMTYSDDLIVKRVAKQVRERTKENMNVYFLGLADAFDEAFNQSVDAEMQQMSIFDFIK